MGAATPAASDTACRVLVIDDHPLFRKGAAQLVGMESGFELVGEAPSGARGIEMGVTLEPNLILLDLELKDMSGIDVLRELRSRGIEAAVVILTVSDASDDLLHALRCGADGYLLKDMEPEEILLKLRHAAAGQVVLDDAITALLANTVRGDGRGQAGDVVLTDREDEILKLIAAGRSNKMIARELGISDGTVKVHVKNLLRKLNVRSRLEAAVWAIDRNGTR